MIDFESYVRALVADYEEDELCTYYVDLGCRSGDGSIYKPMDEYVDRWLDDPDRKVRNVALMAQNYLNNLR